MTSKFENKVICPIRMVAEKMFELTYSKSTRRNLYEKADAVMTNILEAEYQQTRLSCLIRQLEKERTYITARRCAVQNSCLMIKNIKKKKKTSEEFDFLSRSETLL